MSGVNRKLSSPLATRTSGNIPYQPKNYTYSEQNVGSGGPSLRQIAGRIDISVNNFGLLHDLKIIPLTSLYLHFITRRRLQRPLLSLAWRLNREMRRRLILHELAKGKL